MKLNIEREEKDLLIVHLVFALICVPVLFIPIAIGIKLFILVSIYNILIPLFSYWRRYNNWIKIWLFAFILSIFQIWPDWFLADQLGTIAFPLNDGSFHIGPVSGYMIRLWAIPFFVIIFVGQRVQQRKTRNYGYLAVAIISFSIFAISEETLWSLGSWYAQNVVVMLDHVAVYIIIPEIILGLSAYYFYEIVLDKPHWYKIPATFIVMMLYVGTAASSYFLIEKVLFSI